MICTLPARLYYLSIDTQFMFNYIIYTRVTNCFMIIQKIFTITIVDCIITVVVRSQYWSSSNSTCPKIFFVFSSSSFYTVSSGLGLCLVLQTSTADGYH